MIIRFKKLWRGMGILAVLGAAAPWALAAEHVTLKNGFELDCVRREVNGDRVKLFVAGSAATASGAFAGGEANYLEVPASAVVRVETLAEVSPVIALRPASAAPLTAAAGKAVGAVELTAAEMRAMLARAGVKHNIDADLLGSLVKAESGGKVTAVSRTGARGLMQLMPGTASGLGVKDAFRPEENIAGGTAYLDQLLTRYHDNMALALAAYNAGPGAVDRWHGVPPYKETRAYVARVIREFNRRKLLLVASK